MRSRAQDHKYTDTQSSAIGAFSGNKILKNVKPRQKSSALSKEEKAAILRYKGENRQATQKAIAGK